MVKIHLKLGHCVMTEGAKELLERKDVSAMSLVVRHRSGDWGDICKDDIAVNEEALIHSDRVMSVYDLDGESIWIITEADRSSTTILLPEEY